MAEFQKVLFPVDAVELLIDNLPLSDGAKRLLKLITELQGENDCYEPQSRGEGQARLADELDIDRRHCRRLEKECEDRGYLKRVVCRGKLTIYQVDHVAIVYGQPERRRRTADSEPVEAKAKPDAPGQLHLSFDPPAAAPENTAAAGLWQRCQSALAGFLGLARPSTEAIGIPQDTADARHANPGPTDAAAGSPPIVTPATADNDRQVIVVGRLQPGCLTKYEKRPQFSADGKRWCYRVRNANGRNFQISWIFPSKRQMANNVRSQWERPQNK